MKQYLHVDHAGYAAIRTQLVKNELEWGSDLATIKTLRDFGVEVPAYVTEVEIVVVSYKPYFAQLEDLKRKEDFE